MGLTNYLVTFWGQSYGISFHGTAVLPATDIESVKALIVGDLKNNSRNIDQRLKVSDMSWVVRPAFTKIPYLTVEIDKDLTDDSSFWS